MYLQNLEFEEINVAAFKIEVLTGIQNEPDVTAEEAEAALTTLYEKAESGNKFYLFGISNELRKEKIDLTTLQFGGFSWEKLRQFVCSLISSISTAEEILDAVLRFIEKYIWGVVFGPLVRKILKYLLGIAYNALCPAPTLSNN